MRREEPFSLTSVLHAPGSSTRRIDFIRQSKTPRFRNNRFSSYLERTEDEKLWMCLLSLLIVASFFNAARAQGTTGSIAGTVIDANGAVLPNAIVTVDDQTIEPPSVKRLNRFAVIRLRKPKRVFPQTSVRCFRVAVLTSSREVNVCRST